MHGGGGKVDINGANAIIALQARALHDIVAFRVGRSEVSFKSNIFHKVDVIAQPFQSLRLLSRWSPCGGEPEMWSSSRMDSKKMSPVSTHTSGALRQGSKGLSCQQHRSVPRRPFNHWG